MYKLMYKASEDKNWQCIGTYTDIEMTLEHMDKLEQGVLGMNGATFKLVKEGYDVH